MFTKLLIANRGEIAIRIARTAADQGLSTLAIFTQDDHRSLHTRYADDAAELPGSGVAGYLDISAIIEIAKTNGCDAIHPGYGLLSERADFAEACADANITFIGPGPDVLRANGDKVAARQLAEKASVPVIPGRSDIASADDLAAFFSEQGERPLMVKAVSGGGGRGMRVVRAYDEIGPTFDACTAEASSAFGSGALYAERFLPHARHIEVQIVGDGNDVVHLFERDCSVQRRHQKIVEIAPAPHLSDKVRQRLYDDACRIGQACHYQGIGTVEFLLDTTTEEYVFIETNPRIQVEHTITEEITGVDLVAIQLDLARGRTLRDLGLLHDSIRRRNGYAIQLRINAETMNTDGSMAPTSGEVTDYLPASGPGVRVDSYLYAGYQTNPLFDNLLAKLIIRSGSSVFPAALAKADRALSELQIRGLPTNADLLRSFIRQERVTNWNGDVASFGEGLRAAALDKSEASQRQPATEEGGSKLTAEHSPTVDIPPGCEAIVSPIQALVHAVLVEQGQTFAPGEEIAILEAMKMQHAVKAPMAGRVHSVHAAPGDTVVDQQTLLIVAPDDAAAQHNDVQKEVDLALIRPDLAAFQERVSFTLDENRPDAVTRRHGRGQRTARENIADIIADGSLVEYGQLTYAAQRTKHPRKDLMKKSPGDGVVAGLAIMKTEQGRGPGRDVAILAYDGTVFAGTQGAFGHQKTDRLFDVAADLDIPIIFLAEGGGGRPNDVDFQDIIRSGLGVTTFHHFARHKSYAPNITMVSGFCFAGNAAVFGAGDIKIATRNAWIGLGGPAMIEGGGLGTVEPTEIGPAAMQAGIGLVDILVDDDAEACEAVRQVMTYFEQSTQPWEAGDERALRHAVPEDRKRVYDMRALISDLADTDGFLELRPQFALGMITGLIRIEGHPMGVMANNPGHLGGAVDAAASKKGAEFLTFCERFKLPVLSLCDTPGFMVGPASEEDGGVKEACGFIRAGAELTTPLIFICTRKGYGIGAQAMAGGTFIKPVANFSWPTGEFGPMGLEGSVRLGFKRELEAAPTPEAQNEMFEQMVASMYKEGHALNIASLLEIDGVIDPADTRKTIISVLQAHQKDR
ncbi:MAG: carboxyl transferase domain-containing protein [Pseudomonadota bacterium]